MAARKKLPRLEREPWRNRIVGHGTMTAEEFALNPRNPRIHTGTQRSAMSAMLTDVGWVDEVLVNKTTGLVLDGHMRIPLAAGRGPVPVTFVELTVAEEAQVLALMDPIGAMAGHNSDVLADLLDGSATTVDIGDVLGHLLPQPDVAPAAPKPTPETRELAPLQRAHVLISVPLDMWDEIADVLDQLSERDGVTISTSVN